MFVRADHLLAQTRGGEFGRHLVHFGWEGFEPVLLAYDQHEDEVEAVDLKDIDWRISERKRCVGSFSQDGYHRCPQGMPVRSFSQCPSCARSWIGNQNCIFEPSCPGDRCESKLCRREHTVYIAFFSNLAKVGMTSSLRLQERGIEQGADAIAPLVRRPNRLEGRAAEKEVSKLLKLPQTMPRRRVLGLLGDEVSPEGIRVRYESVREHLGRMMETLEGELIVLDHYPYRPLGRPELVDIVGHHQGRLVGLKGKFLLYQDQVGEVKALDMSDLPGRFLIPGRENDFKLRRHG